MPRPPGRFRRTMGKTGSFIAHPIRQTKAGFEHTKQFGRGLRDTSARAAGVAVEKPTGIIGSIIGFPFFLASRIARAFGVGAREAVRGPGRAIREDIAEKNPERVFPNRRGRGGGREPEPAFEGGNP